MSLIFPDDNNTTEVATKQLVFPDDISSQDNLNINSISDGNIETNMDMPSQIKTQSITPLTEDDIANKFFNGNGYIENEVLSPEIKNSQKSDDEIEKEYIKAVYDRDIELAKELPDGREKNLKLLEIERKKRDSNRKFESSKNRENTVDRAKKVGNIQAIKYSEPIVALARISEDIANIGRGLVGAEKSTLINDYWNKKQDEIKAIEKELGYKEGDLLTPSNVGEIASNLVYTAMPFLKTSGTLGKIAGTEATVAGAQEYGATGDPKESIKQASIAGSTAIVGGKAFDYLGNKIISRLNKEPTNKLHTRLKELIDLSSVNENELYENYAKLQGVNVEDLTVNEKITAIAYGNPEAKQVLDASLGRVEAKEYQSQFHDYAKNVAIDLKNKIDSGDIVEIQKLVNGVSDNLSEGYKDFVSILDNNYGDVYVALPKDKEVVAVMRDLVRDIPDTNTKRAILKKFQKSEVGLSDLYRIKVLIGERLGSLKSPMMSPSDKMAYDKTREIYSKVDSLFKGSLPEDASEMYGSLSKLYKMKSTADKKLLFNRFREEGTNIESKHLETIAKEMKAPRKGSSYDSFISLMGKRSTESNKVEGALIDNIINSNSKDGFVDLAKVMENLDELQFKTPQGKALKEVLSLYQKALRNVGDTKQGMSIPSEGQGLTINPIISEAYNTKTNVLNMIKENLGWGITEASRKRNKAVYVLKKLPEVLETKKMPQGYTLKEQRGAVAFSRLMSKLKELGNQTSEELEIGKAGQYYETSQMIGEKGSANIPDIDSSGTRIIDSELLKVDKEEAIKKGWEETKWYFDDMDGKWKFHLNGTDVRLKASKAMITKTGTYKLSDVIDMPDLFKAYPELANREVKFASRASNNLGGYNPHSGNIVLNSNYNWNKNGNPMKDVKGTLVHEIQHAIQGIEEFATGANSNGKTFREYASSHGEVEARALTQGKVGTYPKKIYDEEYDTGFHASGGDYMPLTKDITNYRGTPPGSNKPEEVIPRGKRFNP